MLTIQLSSNIISVSISFNYYFAFLFYYLRHLLQQFIILIRIMSSNLSQRLPSYIPYILYLKVRGGMSRKNETDRNSEVIPKIR